MATLTRVEGWDYGLINTLTGFEGVFDGMGTTGGTPTVSTTHARTGTYSMRVNKATGVSWGRYAIAQDYIVGQVWIYPEALPAGADQRIVIGEGPGGVGAGVVFRADGTVGVKIGPNTAVYGTAQITAGAWHRIDFKMFFQSTTWTVDYAVNGVAQTQVPGTGRTAGVSAYLYLGSSNSADVFDLYYDDLTISVTAGDYPLVASSVYAVVPTGDGTHNAGTNVMEDDAGTDIGAVTAYNHLNTIAGSTTAYVQQVAIGTGNYAEVTFGNRSAPDPGGAILAARAFVGMTSSGTGANHGKVLISDDGFTTEDVVWNSIHAPATTPVRWVSTNLVNALDIDNLKARAGYSSDVTPNPRWSLIMVQYAVADVVDAKRPVHRHVISKALTRASRW